MSMSVGGIGSAYGMSFVRPMNYTLRNEASVSDAYMKTGRKGAVKNVPPVVYPNAQVLSAGYSKSGEATSMDPAGSTLDLFA